MCCMIIGCFWNDPMCADCWHHSPCLSRCGSGGKWTDSVRANSWIVCHSKNSFGHGRLERVKHGVHCGGPISCTVARAFAVKALLQWIIVCKWSMVRSTGVSDVIVCNCFHWWVCTWVRMSARLGCLNSCILTSSIIYVHDEIVLWLDCFMVEVGPQPQPFIMFGW